MREHVTSPLSKASRTHAIVASVDLHVLRWTDAGVIPQCVVTRPGPAHTGVCETLVDIYNKARRHIKSHSYCIMNLQHLSY